MKEKKKKAYRRRILLLALLGLLIMGAGYYLLVYNVVERDLRDTRAKLEDTEQELTVAQEKALRMDQMEAELIAIRSDDSSRMESYNNTKQELYLLNRILKDTTDYSVSFQKVTRDGDQIRRSFSMDFSVDSYTGAMNIIRQLQNSVYRCLLGDVAYSRTQGTGSRREMIHISVDATFYETMVGGTPDAGLPASSSTSE